jgi:ATP phosphoribosyltransferase
MGLGFGRSRFRFAGPRGSFTDLTQLAGTRIATSYVGVVRSFLEEHGIDATVVRLDGAVETSIQLGVADVIADVVETGSTLRQAGLETFGDTILDSEAVLVTRSGAVPDGFEVFKRRVQGVLVARTYVMMDYDIPSDRVTDAVRLTPGIESPTVAPLHREGWSAVRAMVPRDGAQRLMDELFEIGARGILLTDIHACRL